MCSSHDLLSSLGFYALLRAQNYLSSQAWHAATLTLRTQTSV